jgi:hypothetical protein
MARFGVATNYARCLCLCCGLVRRGPGDAEMTGWAVLRASAPLCLPILICGPLTASVQRTLGCWAA